MYRIALNALIERTFSNFRLAGSTFHDVNSFVSNTCLWKLVRTISLPGLQLRYRLGMNHIKITAKGLHAFLEASFEMQLQMYVYYNGYQLGKDY